jgi:hypothetical protein
MLLGTSFGCGEVRIGVFETAPEALVQVHTVEQPLGSDIDEREPGLWCSVFS